MAGPVGPMLNAGALGGQNLSGVAQNKTGQAVFNGNLLAGAQQNMQMDNDKTLAETFVQSNTIRNKLISDKLSNIAQSIKG